MAKSKKQKMRLYTILLCAIIVLAAITIILTAVSIAGRKKPEPEPVSSSDGISVSQPEPESSSSGTESESSPESQSSPASTPEPDSSGYIEFTGEKTVLNAFDENGQLNLLYPVSKLNPIKSTFQLASKATVSGDYVMDSRAAGHAKQLLAAIKRDLNSSIRPYSTFRSYSHQLSNFNRKKQQYLDKGYSEADAYATAATIVAVPGTSEHQIGLAMDLYLDSLYNRDGELNDSFEDTSEYEWLIEHAWEYGFILSFPKDKTAQTGIIYEPWHYRYVGLEYAKLIKESGLTLSEWLDSKNVQFIYND